MTNDELMDAVSRVLETETDDERCATALRKLNLSDKTIGELLAQRAGTWRSDLQIEP